VRAKLGLGCLGLFLALPRGRVLLLQPLGRLLADGLLAVALGHRLLSLGTRAHTAPAFLSGTAQNEGGRLGGAAEFASDGQIVAATAVLAACALLGLLLGALFFERLLRLLLAELLGFVLSLHQVKLERDRGQAQG
jgi:hypothetical protein